jgi:hypothetical protein
VADVKAVCVCVQNYEILIYCITFIVNNLIVISVRNNTFLISLPSFCSTDPFLFLLKIVLGKGTQTSASL